MAWPQELAQCAQSRLRRLILIPRIAEGRPVTTA